MNRQSILAILLVLSFSSAGFCGEADVVGVEVKSSDNGLFDFVVTVRHADAGWEHYADKWEVLAPDGTVLGSRTLYHPHVDEQPFTRSLAGVRIPADISTVTVRAHDSVHGYGGQTISVKLSQ